MSYRDLRNYPGELIMIYKIVLSGCIMYNSMISCIIDYIAIDSHWTSFKPYSLVFHLLKS